jgi:hypothetical protein
VSRRVCITDRFSWRRRYTSAVCGRSVLRQGGRRWSQVRVNKNSTHESGSEDHSLNNHKRENLGILYSFLTMPNTIELPYIWTEVKCRYLFFAIYLLKSIEEAGTAIAVCMATRLRAQRSVNGGSIRGKDGKPFSSPYIPKRLWDQSIPPSNEYRGQSGQGVKMINNPVHCQDYKYLGLYHPLVLS